MLFEDGSANELRARKHTAALNTGGAVRRPVNRERARRVG